MSKESRRWPILGTISSVLLLISIMLPWSSTTVFGTTFGFNAFDHGVAGVFICLFSMVAIASFLVKLVVPTFQYRSILPWFGLGAGALSLLFTILAIITVVSDKYDPRSLSFGVFLAIIASIATIAFSLLAKFGSKGIAQMADSIQQNQNDFPGNQQGYYPQGNFPQTQPYAPQMFEQQGSQQAPAEVPQPAQPTDDRDSAVQTPAEEPKAPEQAEPQVPEDQPSEENKE